ncbi:unnamed protein product [Umbelopsis vinacea]
MTTSDKTKLNLQMTTVVSAPGKVLVTGGYLVLDPAYHGLVIGTNARFYTIAHGNTPVIFRTATSTSYPETCLRTCFRVLYEKLGEKELVAKLGCGLRIVIVGDNDFYSQRLQLQERNLPTTMPSLRSLPPFCKTSTTLTNVHKTGLGSSAALITSLVAAILVHFRAVTSLDDEADRVLVHNTAQQAHCLAQGKVGSGFDVSAAVWGSHRYRRFDPNVLEPAMDEQVDSKTLYSTVSPSNSAWDNVVTPVKLPPRLRMMLADIDAGSHTPTLVGKVLSWRKQNASESKALWDSLHSYNTKVEEDLRALNACYEQDQQGYINAIDQFAAKKASEWKSLDSLDTVQSKLLSLYENFNKVRQLIRDMSDKSSVPIEPSEQSKLLDACMDCPGVIMAGVPGAGGYDAIFCITLSDDASSQVEDVWRTWTEMNVGPLLASEDSHGARIEDFNQVVGLAEAASN